MKIKEFQEIEKAIGLKIYKYKSLFETMQERKKYGISVFLYIKTLIKNICT